MQAKFTMDPAQWTRATGEYERIIKTAETKAIRDVGIMARDAGRAMIANAGFSQRWQNSLIARFSPSSGVSFSPSANIKSTISYSDVFETGKTIAGEPWLWMPLPQVPSIAGRPHMTPKQYIQNVGPLVVMKRPGQPPMLGAQVRTAFTPGRFLSRATLRRGRATARGTFQTIPMFVAVSAVHIPKKWSIHDACVEAAKKLPERYVANLEKYK